MLDIIYVSFHGENYRFSSRLFKQFLEEVANGQSVSMALADFGNHVGHQIDISNLNQESAKELLKSLK